ncbi:MAG TPA: hypothetical protein PKM12_02260 [Marmoricola sp.]|nr:hypothetical protein [Marmoricola sp.]HNO38908.1 hypothetical protein [Marmoricola sp.]
MTWNNFHRRGETLRIVEEVANQRVDAVLPTDVPGVSEHFYDDLDLIAALVLRWHTRLAGNVDRALVSQPWDLPTAVEQAWANTAQEMAGVRLIIDQYTQHPTDEDMGRALLKAELREWMRLATWAGLASDQSEAAAAVGRRVQEDARILLAKMQEDQPSTPAASGSDQDSSSEHPSHVSLVERIKAVLAA